MINLLPPKEKEKLFWQRQKKVVFVLGVLGLFCLLLFWLSLKIVEINLETQKRILAIESQRQKDSLAKVAQIKKEIKNINQALEEIVRIYENQKYVADILAKLASLLPQEAQLESLIFDKKENRIQMNGRIKTLAGLNQLKELLEKEESFHQVEISIGTYVPGQKIEFRIQITL